MSNILIDAIYERLRELAEDGVGNVRTIQGRFGGNLPEGTDVEEELRRGILTLAPAEINLKMRKHPQHIARLGNVQIHLLDAEIRVVRTLSVAEHVDDDLRDDVKTQAIVDGNALCQVLEIPANLHTTEGGNPTGLVGGEYVDSNPAYRGKAAGEAQSLVTIHRFTFTAVSSPDSIGASSLLNEDAGRLLTEDGFFLLLE